MLTHLERRRGLYAITDGPRGDLLEVCAAALAGGVRLLQYRDKTTDASRRHAEAAALLRLCRAYDVPLIVNDDVLLAQAVGADGVHLGEDDSDPAQARERLGSEAIIGASCYDSLDRAADMARRGASYLAFGAFFASPTKPGARRASTALLQAARSLDRPLVAIGGITPDNARGLIDAGADFVAAITGVFGAGDVRSAAARYASLFTDATDIR